MTGIKKCDNNVAMNEDEMIKELAKPIIEKLKELEKTYEGDHTIMEIPRIKFIHDGMNGPIEIDGVEIDDVFIERLEQYVQDEIEMSHTPTILH